MRITVSLAVISGTPKAVVKKILDQINEPDKRPTSVQFNQAGDWIAHLFVFRENRNYAEVSKMAVGGQRSLRPADVTTLRQQNPLRVRRILVPRHSSPFDHV
jgi:hypothetical protein